MTALDSDCTPQLLVMIFLFVYSFHSSVFSCLFTTTFPVSCAALSLRLDSHCYIRRLIPYSFSMLLTIPCHLWSGML